MELQEKSAFAWEKPVYDAVSLTILDGATRKNVKVKGEQLKYYDSNPFGVKLRLLLFWTLWIALIVALITSAVAYFCFQPRICHRYKYMNITSVSCDT